MQRDQMSTLVLGLLAGTPFIAGAGEPSPQPSKPVSAPNTQPSETSSNPAPSGNNKEKPPSYPSSGETLGPGDAVIPLMCIPEFTIVKDGEKEKKYSAPGRGHARLKGASKDDKPGTAVFWVDTKRESDGFIQGHFVKHRTVLGVSREEEEGQLEDCGGEEGVTLNKKYYVNSDALNTYAITRAGLTYGALTIPYKWHGSDHSFDAAPTVGAFVGFYLGRPGADAALVISAGLGSVSVPTMKNGQAANDLKASLSLALGPVITLTRGQRFQLGILLGTDWVTSAAKADYKYNGKLWAALSLGVDLTK